MVRILVVGAGATGGYFGGRLLQAGRDVSFLVRPHRAALLRERGLRITSHNGDDVVLTPTLLTSGQLDEPADLVILAVKATALAPALEDMAAAIGPRTLILPFLNGIAHLDALNARFGADQVLGGVVMVSTHLTSADDIVQLAAFASIQIGTQDGQVSGRITGAHHALAGAGFDTSVSTDIIGAMWHKWVFIATVGALTCLMRGTIGEIVGSPGGSELGPAILAETATVSAAAGHPLAPAARDGINQTVTTPRSTFASSLFRDVTEQRPTEVEHVFADLCARARALDVPTPLLDLTTLHLRVYEERRGRARQDESQRDAGSSEPR